MVAGGIRQRTRRRWCTQTDFLRCRPTVFWARRMQGCGVGDPHVAERLTSWSVVSAPQTYHTPEVYAAAYGTPPPATPGARALQPVDSESYSDEVPFIPLSTLYAQGLAGHIRITPVWGAMANSTTDGGVQRQCAFAGQNITVTGSSGGNVGYTCAAADVSVPGTARYAQIVSRTNAAAAYWGSVLQIRPVQDSGITVDPSITTRFNLPSPMVVPDTDVVNIMIAEPSPYSPIAGYAACLQEDQYHRCTVG
jgi:hypothetical protein